MSGATENPSATQDMQELLESVEPMKPLRKGDVVEGVVMRSDSEGVLVNIGHKAEGLVPPAEMRTLTREGQDLPGVGDEIVASVVSGEGEEGSAVLSIDRAVGEMGWLELDKALESGQTVNGRILGFNRGGALVDVEGVRGFVPMSQLVTVSRDNFQPQDSQAPSDDGGERPLESPDIDRVLELKVLEVNRSRNRAIFSERQAVREMREERKAKLIQELSQGEVRKGKVTGISSFGAFVDLGGADGLIHISELAWTPVSSPEEIVKVGDELDVYVLRVDPETKRIALSLKRLQQEPWETITERYQVGDVVSATVTKLTDFGAFARLEDSVEGLIHVSELTSRAINHPREVVKEGDPVRPKILRIEPERRRLGLSLRQAEAELAEAGLVETGQVEAEQAEAEQPEAGLVGTEQVEAEQAEEEQPVADQPEKKS